MRGPFSRFGHQFKAAAIRAVMVFGAVALVASMAPTASARERQGAIGRPTTSTFGGWRPTPGYQTVPTFTDSFRFDAVTYPYTMVGANPKTSNATTTVATQVIPLRFVFSDGTTLDGTPRLPAVVASPLFSPADFVSGRTQFSDAFRRAEFWPSVQFNGGDYHTLLGQPRLLPTVTLTVPKGRSKTGAANGVTYGLVDYQWFFGEIQRLLGQMRPDPTTLPVFLSDAVDLHWGSDYVNNCCVVGSHGTHSYGIGSAHGQGNQQVTTVIWASWEYAEHFGNGNDLGGKPFGGDIAALSHEVAEWLDDPFVNNLTPNWSSALAPGYGCVDWLEVGDPLIAEDFEVDGYHLQDEAFLSWFAHDVPSAGINGQYSLFGTLTSPSTLC